MMEQKKESIDYGVIIARKDGTFVIDNYHVCHASIDPHGKYDFDDVKAYAAANPDKVTPEPVLSELTAEEKSAIARRQRDALLAACDWTQVADAPVDQTAWKAYRQALRDWPESQGFPDIAMLPKAPIK